MKTITNRKKLFLLIFFINISFVLLSQSWSSLNFGNYTTVKSITFDTINNLTYAGGFFNTAGGKTIKNIAKWNGTMWDSLKSGISGYGVYATKMYNGNLYATGSFTSAGNTLCNNIAMWDGNNWYNLGSGLNNTAFALEVYNGELYVAGSFTSAGGTPSNYIAKWNGSSWSQVGAGVDNIVLSIKSFNGKLYFGGFFQIAGSNPASYIASWDGTNWSNVGAGFNNGVRNISVFNNELYAAGDFTQSSTTNCNYIARFNGASFLPLGTGFDASASSMTSYNCELYVSGTFTNAGGLTVSGLAKWSAVGGWANINNPSIPTNIEGIISRNNNLYVYGTFYPPFNSSLMQFNSPVAISTPTALASVSENTVRYGNNVQFFTNSINATGYTWLMPGATPSVSANQNPIVIYPTVGTYSVKLIASNCNGSDTLKLLNYIIVDSLIHNIPNGHSSDFLTINTPSNTTIYEGNYNLYYYKPPNYNSSSPILLYAHGLGGNGSSSIDLQAIADREKALIVAPTMHNGVLGWAYATELLSNSITGCNELYWYTQVFKDIYRHVLSREGRSSMNTYLTGFSAGGQFVTRYMLIRQFSPDSIPIKMAVSVNPSNYTLMTDTFNNTPMDWGAYRCGLAGSGTFTWNCTPIVTKLVKNFICNEHVKQYYNENYGVLIGTADTQTFTSFCPGQGTNRVDRAKKFYNFSQSNAISRGTTVQWRFDSVQNIGHDNNLMYNTKRNITDTFTIAERLLFKTLFHTVPQFTPACTNILSVNEALLKPSDYIISPNPANDICTISLKGIAKSNNTLKVELYNSTGQLITELVKGTPLLTETELRFNTKVYSSGLYFIKTTYGDQAVLKKLIISH